MRKPVDLYPGQTFADRFRLGAVTRDGVHTQTFAADDATLGRPVSVVVTKTVVDSNAESVAAAALGVAEHPNLIGFLAHGRDPATGAVWLATEPAGSRSLASMVRDAGHFEPARALGLALQILSGLEVLVDAGRFVVPVPGDIGIEEPERIRLRVVADLESSLPGVTGLGGPSRDTAFLPPEHPGGEVGPPSSVYAAAASLYFMLTGVAPLRGARVMEIMLAVMSPSPPAAPSTLVPGPPPALDALVLAALDKDPAKRPAHPRELAARLSALDPGKARVVGLTAAQFLPRSVAAEPPRRPFALVVRGHDGRLTRISPDRKLLAGRNALTMDIWLPETAASSVHCAIEPTATGHAVSDLRSANGTFVNGARIEGPRALAPDDVISVGFSEILYTNRPDPEWGSVLAKFPVRGRRELPGDAHEPDPGLDLSAALERAKPGLQPAAVPLAKRFDVRPLLIFMESPAYAVLIARQSSLPTYWVRNAADALTALATRSFVGIVALSPSAEPGAAGRVIATARVRSPDLLTVYHGCDYRVEVSAKPALRCGADLMIVGGVDSNQLMQFIMTGLKTRAGGKAGPPTLSSYVAFLHEICKTSPFWEVAERMRVEKAPPVEHE